MQPLPGSGRGTRLTLVALGLVVLLAVVALASRTGFTHHDPQGSPSEKYTSYAMTVFLIVFVLMIPFAVYAYAIRIQEQATARRLTGRARVVVNLVRLALVFVVAYVLFTLRRHHPNLLRNLPFGFNKPRTTGAHAHGQVPKPYNPTFQWNVLWIALVLLAAASAYGYYRWKTSRRGLVLRDPELTVAEDFAASIDDAIDDLESEPDARRAVIAAYARMESALGRSGLQRALSETAFEYLSRVLLGLTSRGDPVRRLTGLFEQAKFSDHEIDTSMKQDAIGALREIRADLQAAPA